MKMIFNIILLFFFNQTIIVAISSLEIFALKDFYESTDGKNWKMNQGWNSTLDPCIDWIGIECNSNGSIKRILLANNSLMGVIPSSFNSLRFSFHFIETFKRSTSSLLFF
eukprot:TRINITY_DN3816_c0_g1_i3.p1 TRINITY_DN3816_c0_g1~~TRINITY_DN3816_c0_g1_i3.p1  ORF type:complete len:110 (-),score=30.96 TRINITY_DN3816_c0_g1_i3:33-362(-)